MPVVRIEHSVPDFDAWKQVFDSDPAGRKGAGVRRYSVSRLHDDPNFVFIDLEFGSMDDVAPFLAAMRKLWGGPAAAIALQPTARVADVVETVEL